MQSNAVCTIVTKSHISWALSLFDSISEYTIGVDCYVLVSDLVLGDGVDLPETPLPVNVLGLNDMLHVPFAQEIYTKYKQKPDFLRWSMKSVLMQYLLMEKCERVLFFDCDIVVFSGLQFLFDKLQQSNVLITPHGINPHIATNLGYIHRTGLCNGGFVAASRNGLGAIKWWASACYNECSHRRGGVNVDQGYLEYLPFYFDGVEVLQHPGCNVAYWNLDYIERHLTHDGKCNLKTATSESFPLVFYHFGTNRYSHFYDTDEIRVFFILEKLHVLLTKYGWKKNVLEQGKQQLLPKPLSMRWKTQLRTAASNTLWRILGYV